MGKRRKVTEEVEPVDFALFDLEVNDPSARGVVVGLELGLLGWLMSGVHVQGRRISPTMTVWHDGVTWRGALHDRANNLVAYDQGQLLGDLLANFAQRLRSEDTRWRPDRKEP